MQAIAAHTGDADIHVLRTPRAVRRFFARVASGVPDQPLTARTDNRWAAQDRPRARAHHSRQKWASTASGDA